MKGLKRVTGNGSAYVPPTPNEWRLFEERITAGHFSDEVARRNARAVIRAVKSYSSSSAEILLGKLTKWDKSQLVGILTGMGFEFDFVGPIQTKPRRPPRRKFVPRIVR